MSSFLTWQFSSDYCTSLQKCPLTTYWQYPDSRAEVGKPSPAGQIQPMLDLYDPQAKNVSHILMGRGKEKKKKKMQQTYAAPYT